MEKREYFSSKCRSSELSDSYVIVRQGQLRHGFRLIRENKMFLSDELLPPLNYVKLNTDEDSKGNPGLAAGGGRIREESWQLARGVRIAGFCSLLHA